MKKYLIAGLLVWLPLAITVWVLHSALGLIDGVFGWFVTGKPGGEAATHLSGDYLSIYVPTTPNPTSGFFLMVPRADVVSLRMSVDEALKYVISMGVVAPPANVVSLPQASRN